MSNKGCRGRKVKKSPRRPMFDGQQWRGQQRRLQRHPERQEEHQELEYHKTK